MRFIIKKVDDLTSVKSCCFANADLELARWTFGDCHIAIVFGELDGEGFYCE
jgi:hypothetical protein